MNQRTINANKLEKVNFLEEIFKEHKGVALFENKGINANEINVIRKRARAENIQIIIEKNTLWKIALKNTIKNPEIKGKTIALVGTTAIDALGFSSHFTKEEKKLLIPTAIMDKNGGIFNEKQIKSLANIKNHTDLMATLVMTLKMPMIKLVKVLDLSIKNSQTLNS